MREMLNTHKIEFRINLVLLNFLNRKFSCLFDCSRWALVVLVSGAGCDNVTTVLLGAQIKMRNGFPQLRLSFYTLHAPAHAISIMYL